MRIVHLSYAQVLPRVTNPREWLQKISFLTGVMSALAHRAEVIGVFHIDYKGEVKESGVTFHFTGFTKASLLWPTKLHRFVTTLNPDVIIVHGLIFPFQILMLRRAVGQQVMIICQHHAERPFKDFRTYLQRLADREIGAYLFSSAAQGEEWVRAGQISSSHKVQEVMGTSSPFGFQERAAARAITKVNGEPVYVWVGALEANKDPLTLVRAFMKYLINSPGASLYMIYQNSDLEDDIRGIIDTNHIHLVGPVERGNMSTWLNSADFIISTSHYEGSGIAVCEGMSCGCIPILTSIPSFRMMTNNGEIGLLFEAGNADALYEALMKSKQIPIASFREKTLKQFKSALSFDANAKKIFKVIKSLSR